MGDLEKRLAVHIGDRIRWQRQARRWSQKDLAEEIGATQCQISHWEKGRRVVPLDTLFYIAHSLCAPMIHFLPKEDDLFGLPEPPVPHVRFKQ